MEWHFVNLHCFNDQNNHKHIYTFNSRCEINTRGGINTLRRTKPREHSVESSHLTSWCPWKQAANATDDDKDDATSVKSLSALSVLIGKIISRTEALGILDSLSKYDLRVTFFFFASILDPLLND